MCKIYYVVLILILSTACKGNNNKAPKRLNGFNKKTEAIIDSLLYYRHHFERTDILSRQLPELSRKRAIAIQLEMLKKELDSGAEQVGWKLGGTVTNDSARYDPLFGYILKSNLIQEDSILSTKNMPGGSIYVEGEVGFLMKKDFKHGAKSLSDLEKGIAYVVNAVELTDNTALPHAGVPDSINLNHNIAAGLGQVGTIIGSEKAKIEDFNLRKETIKCFINDSLAAKGISDNVYGGPLNALYSLVNMLPKYGTFLKKGEVVITGSVYHAPVVSHISKIRVKSSTLGTINFGVKN